MRITTSAARAANSQHTNYISCLIEIQLNKLRAKLRADKVPRRVCLWCVVCVRAVMMVVVWSYNDIVSGARSLGLGEKTIIASSSVARG